MDGASCGFEHLNENIYTLLSYLIFVARLAERRVEHILPRQGAVVRQLRHTGVFSTVFALK